MKVQSVYSIREFSLQLMSINGVFILRAICVTKLKPTLQSGLGYEGKALSITTSSSYGVSINLTYTSSSDVD
jgi:hypothetical protein